jgi:hypothetical protein
VKSVSRSRAAVAIAGSALAGLVIGGGVLASSHEAAPSQTPVRRAQSEGLARSLPSTSTEASSYPRNAAGQTYGEYRLGGEKPDLVPVEASNGLSGYAYLSDMLWEPAKSPEEAVAQMKQHVNDSGEVVVPVYELDGKTRIGTFVAGTVEYVEQ